ncbi:MAG: glucose 1-dehydrogenase [Rhodospirillaceae bacterium]|jgi:NAD(P)-dependent dehydrogenase (short-subunit alcohol dehydrogenase family)|nr:glucose 1-dehydrogenase [Rhodospirillaceae bacterium]MBT5667720.1 glucose 1-dehydrogenase [Rhodospirillaceae bacterium]MBT5809657.1 glucose 1-dehydrogenase [Rhodospirillaceae bacterium]
MGSLLQGHIALVTGAGSGIGQGVAVGYAAEGARVICVDINEAGAAETTAMIAKAGGDASSYELDVTDAAACGALAETVERDIGQVSVLVNNAGVVRRAPITSKTAVQDWADVLAVNIHGVFNVTHAFLGALKARKGRIINLGSIQSFVHTPNSVAYTTSKGAVRNFTTGLAAELGPDGVRVNAIGPGLIQTPLNKATIHEGAEIYDNFMRHTPMKRPGTPADIVGPAVFLASDLSQYVTGVTLPVDGGYLTV